jgi:hypothetical protein
MLRRTCWTPKNVYRLRTSVQAEPKFLCEHEQCYNTPFFGQTEALALSYCALVDQCPPDLSPSHARENPTARRFVFWLYLRDLVEKVCHERTLLSTTSLFDIELYLVGVGFLRPLPQPKHLHRIRSNSPRSPPSRKTP